MPPAAGWSEGGTETQVTGHTDCKVFGSGETCPWIPMRSARVSTKPKLTRRTTYRGPTNLCQAAQGTLVLNVRGEIQTDVTEMNVPVLPTVI